MIYPPISLPEKLPEVQNVKPSYYLSIGRLTQSKRIDIAIQACNTLGLELKIIGTGKEEHYLRTISGRTIEFLGSCTDQEVERVYRGARGLIFCSRNEDFGMVPVEAMARGVPVIALAEGGVKETVIDGKTGVLFDEPTIPALIGAIERFETMKNEWRKECLRAAQSFAMSVFEEKITAFITSHALSIKLDNNL